MSKNKKRRIILPGEEDLPVDDLPEREEPVTESDSVSAEIAAELDALRAEAARASELEDQLRRAQAEFANAQQRAKREADQKAKFSIESLVQALVPVLDAFDQSLNSIDESASTEQILEGVQLIEREFLRVLNQNGVVRIELNTGDPFNPDEHEALSMVPSDEHPANAVIQIMRPGYRLHERILRAAQVIVAAALPSGTEDE
jgi:molecular chaperone GrpE